MIKQACPGLLQRHANHTKTLHLSVNNKTMKKIAACDIQCRTLFDHCLNNRYQRKTHRYIFFNMNMRALKHTMNGLATHCTDNLHRHECLNGMNKGEHANRFPLQLVVIYMRCITARFTE